MFARPDAEEDDALFADGETRLAADDEREVIDDAAELLDDDPRRRVGRAPRLHDVERDEGVDRVGGGIPRRLE
jgi:hypothetical protein